MTELGTTLQTLAGEIAKANGWEFSAETGGCLLLLEAKPGRTQQVHLSTGADHLQNPTLVIESKVGSVKDVSPERALRANAKLSYGALAAVGEDLVIRASTFVGPGSLSAQESADIVAYILNCNALPPGDNPLPADIEALKDIRFDAQDP